MSTAVHLDETFPAVPESIAYARALLDAVQPPLPPDALRSARLLVSEVVTNAIRHGAGTTVRVRIDRRADALHVEVHDDGTGFVARPPRAESSLKDSGWGLQFVAQLSRRWGVEADHGTTVWFEVELPQESPRATFGATTITRPPASLRADGQPAGPSASSSLG